MSSTDKDEVLKILSHYRSPIGRDDSVRRLSKQEAVSGWMNCGRGEYMVEQERQRRRARKGQGGRRRLCRDISSCIIHTSSAMLPPPLVEAHSVAGFTRKSKDQARRIHTHAHTEIDRICAREAKLVSRPHRDEWIGVSCDSAIRIQKVILRPSSVARALFPFVERLWTTW